MTQMMNFLTSVHCVYLPGLRHAIQYHWLVNPTGKEMKWHAMDWSNMAVKILLESLLVQVYQNAQVIIEKNFLHTHLTVKHSNPNMLKTFKALTMRFASHSPHRWIAGRKSQYEIPDLTDKGRELMEKGMQDGVEHSENIDEMEAGTGINDVLVDLL
ncbi:hypothetical protein F5141DRAFT_1063611 [Pisolithus sp. B1]|nr:hypothetical protein F5141DRAFT_1063611 [Pisolithus sp. B1]